MIQIHVFEYQFKNGEMVISSGGKALKPPSELPEWRFEEDSRVFVIFVYNEGSSKADAIVEADFSPCIIKGWKIYHMEKVKIDEGGMINDRKVTFSIKGMEKNERQRIDVLIKGPSGKVRVELR